MKTLKEKRAISIIMAAILAASVLTGCAGSGANGNTPASESSASTGTDTQTSTAVQDDGGDTSTDTAPQYGDEESTDAPAEDTEETSANLDVPDDYVPTSEDAFDGEIVGGGIQITSYTGTDTDVKIPKTLGGKPVESIGPKTFTGNTNITSITIPAGITAFETGGDGAFAGCTNLTSATVYCKTLTYYFFNGCTSLKNVTLGDTVEKIDSYAFMGCTSLEEIVLPDELTFIGDYAFGRYIDEFSGENIPACTSLKKVVFGKKTETLGSYCFAGCTALTDVNFDGITAFGDYSFLDCTSLPDITITGENEKDKRVFFGTHAFANCTSMKSVTFVPETLDLSTSTQAFGYTIDLSAPDYAPTVRSDFVVYADKFTDGATYAKENGITCEDRPG